MGSDDLGFALCILVVAGMAFVAGGRLGYNMSIDPAIVDSARARCEKNGGVLQMWRDEVTCKDSARFENFHTSKEPGQ